MAYLTGINYGSDQVSSSSYLDDIYLYNSEDGQPIIDTVRNYSEYTYTPDISLYHPTTINRVLNKKKTPTLIKKPQLREIPRSMYDKWRLQTVPKIREGLTDIQSIDSINVILFLVIIFITIIYCMSIFSLTQQIARIRYDNLEASIKIIRDMIKSKV